MDLTIDLSVADGERIIVEGSVTDVKRAPIIGATVEIWHADATGRYAHPNDQSKRLDQPSFIGHGRQRTTSRGQFAFATILPGCYAIDDGRVRASHIHFQATGPCERLVTQMFFANEPLNAADPLLIRARRPEALIATWVTPGPGKRHAHRVARWNIVMTRG